MNQALIQAHEIIHQVANSSASTCPLSIWSKLLNAKKYIDKQILADYEGSAVADDKKEGRA
jgi:hypothetical protein